MLKKISFLIFVLLIEGAALMAVELLSARFIAPFYGCSLYVWTSVIGIAVLGLTLGYYVGGRLAARPVSGKMLAMVLGIAALLVAGMPFSARALMGLTSGMSLLPGVLLTCLLFILPPMLCFGMVGPMVVRLAEQRSGSDARIAGAVYGISTFGGICATFLVGFFLIPFAGLQATAFCSAVALAALVPLCLLWRASGVDQSQVGGQPAGREKRTEAAPAMPANQMWIYGIAVLEGGSVMAVELLAARMLAPFFGTSLDVWAAVMAFTLAGLALGYVTGGLLPARFRLPDALWWALLAAAAGILAMHFIAQQLSAAMAGMAFLTSLLFVSCLVLLPPLLFLGMVPSLLIRYLATGAANDPASVTGRVFTLSSASGIVSLFVTGFLVVPQFGLTNPCIGIGLAVGVVPFIQLMKQKKYLSLIFAGAAIISFAARKVEATNGNVDVKYYADGLLGQVLVADINQYDGQKANDRVLLVNRIGEAEIDRKSGLTKWDYPYFVSSVCSKFPENARVLMMGLGGGQIANILAMQLHLKVDAVELDQRVVDMARDYFFLSNDVNVIVDDARHYLETTNKTYDIIIVDVFHGDIAPPHLLTVESFTTAQRHLSSNGFVIVNFFGFLSGDIGRPGRSVFKTMQAAHFATKILPTNKSETLANSLFIGSVQPQDFSKVRSPLLQFGKATNLDTLFFDPARLNLKDALLFTDDRSALDFINIDGAIEWRNSYYDLTKHFLKDGVPLFE